MLVLQILVLATLLAVLALLIRQWMSPIRTEPARTEIDPRLTELPGTLVQYHTRHDARLEAVTVSLDTLRRDAGVEALQGRESTAVASAALRTELLTTLNSLGETLRVSLDAFRQDNAGAASTLHTDVRTQLESIARKLENTSAEDRRDQVSAAERLNLKLNELRSANDSHQERLRTVVEGRLDKLNTDNTQKLEEMRATVDEKLHTTLHSRLTESFGQVTDQLNKVHSGLGEMSKLSAGVDDLARIFTNVKSRGGFAEVQLGMLLKQMLAPSQYVENARVKPHTQEAVEFAVRFPGHSGETLLPIDAKFPKEDWERLENAYAANDPELVASAGKAFEAAIRTEGKRICEKYINPPITTPHAIMFLPTEGLYAEVVRRDTLQAEIQSKCQVTIAGPSTLSAILTSFQMGFHMLALQEKGDQVWKVLESAKTEFGKFGKLMDRVEGDVGKIQRTLGEVGVRTRAINRSLREVSATSAGELLEFEDFAGVAPRLAANGDEG